MRTFAQHIQRKVTNLDGFWDFTFLGNVPIDEVDLTDIPFDDRMAVPNCFDATPQFGGKRGLAAYRKEVLIAQSGRQRLAFDGVSHWCRVFINGDPLGDHFGGFVPFSFDFELADSGWVELIVLVDNRFNYAQNPLHMEYFDWYHYGGIARSVSLHHLGECWIDDVKITTVALEPPTIEVQLVLQADNDTTETVTVTVDDQDVMEEEIDVSESITLRFNVSLDGAHLWSPDHPHLHQMQVTFGKDDLFERFGIRMVEVSGKDILLNGEPLRLSGFNRHEIHPDSGHSFPDSMLLKDIQLLKDMHCNFVRGSHYPQDPRFLDLCDEHGLLVWSEAIGWQHTEAHLTDPHFLEAQQLHLQEMVQAAYNHPSVIIWGILNESESHKPAARPGYERLLSTIRALDNSRPLTYATCHPYDDLNYDLVDIISINTYPGWYEGELEEIPALLDKLTTHLEAAGFGNKPLIISEIGAGAIPAFHDHHHKRWTEEYQRDLYLTVIQHLFEQRDRVCGLALWLFADFRSSEMLPRQLERPRGFNNKGCLDEYRRPKMSFDLVKEKF